MGQHYYIVNIDKNEYLDPANFGEGTKLMEFGHQEKTLLALTFLLRDSDKQSAGGDIVFSEAWSADREKDWWDNWVGRWAGDRITIIGDYSPSNLYRECKVYFHEISNSIIYAIKAAREWPEEKDCPCCGCPVD